MMDERRVTAGPWSASLDSTGRLSRLSVNGSEILRALYGVVRDSGWDTVPAMVTVNSESMTDDSFDFTFQSIHRSGDVNFEWSGHITGTPDGVITFGMDGVAGSDFLKNRIGFVALHSLNWAGQACILIHPDGSQTRTRYPTEVSPHQSFLNLAAIRQKVDDIQMVEIQFEGDVFETEDQRNWSDASFKTYSTPLARPFPVLMKQGERLVQRVSVRLLRPAHKSDGPKAHPVGAASGAARRIAFDNRNRFVWPPVGVALTPRKSGMASSSQDLSALKPAHLRVDVVANAAGLDGAFQIAEAAATSIPLELAIHVGSGAEGALRRLNEELTAARAMLAAVLIFDTTAPTTTARAVRLVSASLTTVLQQAIPVVVGTDDNFAELNRNPVNLEALGADFVTFSLNPQVHDSSSRSIMETMEALPDLVRTARAGTHGAPVAVGPVTLRPRRNVYDSEPVSDRLRRDGRSVDDRQAKPFAAAWAAACLSVLTEAGVARLTFAEVAGPRGLVPDRPHSPEERYPIFRVLKAVSGARLGIPRLGKRDGIVDALATVSDLGCQVTVANLSPSAQRAEIKGFGDVLKIELSGYEVVSIEVPGIDVNRATS